MQITAETIEAFQKVEKMVKEVVEVEDVESVETRPTISVKLKAIKRVTLFKNPWQIRALSEGNLSIRIDDLVIEVDKGTEILFKVEEVDYDV